MPEPARHTLEPLPLRGEGGLVVNCLRAIAREVESEGRNVGSICDHYTVHRSPFTSRPAFSPQPPQIREQ